MVQSSFEDPRLNHGCSMPGRIRSGSVLEQALLDLSALLANQTLGRELDHIRTRARADRYVLPPGVLRLRLLRSDVIVGNNQATSGFTGQQVPLQNHGSFVLAHRIGLNTDCVRDRAVYLGLSLPDPYDAWPTPLLVRAEADTLTGGRLRYYEARNTIAKLQPLIDPFVLVGSEAAQFMPQITTPPPPEV
jgi:hypothetical protein